MRQQYRFGTPAIHQYYYRSTIVVQLYSEQSPTSVPAVQNLQSEINLFFENSCRLTKSYVGTNITQTYTDDA